MSKNYLWTPTHGYMSAEHLRTILISFVLTSDAVEKNYQKALGNTDGWIDTRESVRTAWSDDILFLR